MMGKGYNPKHVEQFIDKNELFIVASCWIIINTYSPYFFLSWILINHSGTFMLSFPVIELGYLWNISLLISEIEIHLLTEL